MTPDDVAHALSVPSRHSCRDLLSVAAQASGSPERVRSEVPARQAGCGSNQSHGRREQSYSCPRFGKFSLVGLIGAALQVILFDLLAAYLPALLAMPIAVELVVLHNFFWHERFTWRDRRFAGFRQSATRLWRFHAANGLVSIAGNTGLTWWLVQFLKAPPLPSALAAIAACAPLNFLISDRWVYAQNSRLTSDS